MELLNLQKKTQLQIYTDYEHDEIYLGLSIQVMKDDETLRNFKSKIRTKLEETFMTTELPSVGIICTTVKH